MTGYLTSDKDIYALLYKAIKEQIRYYRKHEQAVLIINMSKPNIVIDIDTDERIK
jgi:hypothetical protein